MSNNDKNSLSDKVGSLSEEKRKLFELLKAKKAKEKKQHKSLAPFTLISEEDREKLPSGIEDAFPVSQLQLGMLYHMTLGDSTAAPADYHNLTVFWFKLKKPFDIDIFQQSLRQVVANQQNLRTTFDLVNYSEPMQLIHESGSITAGYEDIRDKSSEEQDRIIKSYAEYENFNHIDVTQLPLIRVHIHHMSDDTICLSFTEPHSIADGWSFHLTFADILKAYVQLQDGEKFKFTKLKTSYSDFVNEELKIIKSEKAKRFWAQKLEECAESEFPRLPGESDDNISLESHKQLFQLRRDVVEGLHRIKSQIGVPLKSIFLAAHAKMLSVVSGKREVTAGLSFNGRMEVETGELVRGLFLNTLPVTLDLSSGSWVDLINQAHRKEQEIVPYRRYPLGKLERDHGRSAFSTMLGFLHFHSLADAQVSEQVEVLKSFDYSKTNFDLTGIFILNPTDNADIQFMGDANLNNISLEQYQDAVKMYEDILCEMSKNPFAPHSEQCFLPEAHRLESIGGHQKSAAFQREQCIHELIQQQAEKYPEKTAVASKEINLSYAELNRQANQLARHLIQQGVQPEDIVGLCVERSVNMIVGMLGILKAGAAYLPLDPNYPNDRLEFMVEDSQTNFLVTQNSSLNKIAHRTCNVIVLDDQKTQQVLLEYRCENLECSELECKPESLAYVIYTSGSTGVPKGVMLEHCGLVNLVTEQAQRYSVDIESRMLQFASVSFDAATWEIFLTLTQGASLHLISEEQSKSTSLLGQYVHQEKINITLLPPTLLKNLSIEQFKSVNTLIVGGEACPQNLVENWSQGRAFYNAYGPTEGTVIATIRHYQGGVLDIGQPIANTKCYVVDELGAMAAVGAPGELYLGGVGLARGYLNREALTDERFIANPFSDDPNEKVYKTGDLVRWLPDGSLEYLGRIDNQVKIRGHRIELGEIEAKLLGNDKVKDAVVVVREDEPGEKRLAAYLVLSDSEQSSDSSETLVYLRSHLQNGLPHYMVPSAFVLLEAMPLTPNGKIDKKALPAPEGDVLLQEAYVAPTTAVEQSLCEIWQNVLRVDRIGIRDNFFAVGGDSILSIQVVSRANAAGIGISTRQLFELQTIEALALNAKDATAEKRQEASEGEQVLLPIHHDYFQHHVEEYQHFHQSMLLQVPSGCDEAFLSAMVKALYQRHDALRLTFESQSAKQTWQAHYRPLDALPLSDAIVIEPLLAGSADERQQQIATRGESFKADFDLAQGPLFKAIFFTADEEQDQRLLLVAHHTVIDGVSWRIVLEDIALGFSQWQSDKSISLPAKTSAYQEWPQRLSEHADVLMEEKAFWLSQLQSPVSALPLDQTDVKDLSQRHSRHVEIRVDESTTEQLLGGCHQAYHTRIQEVLLAGLLLAFKRWQGLGSVRVDLESHGREELFEDIDLSQTVGWFTSLYPLHLSLSDSTDLGHVLKSVKEQVRAIPHQGLGYGVLRYLKNDPELATAIEQVGEHSEVVFNYLGQFDQQAGSEQAFNVIAESTGADTSPRHARKHALGINGWVLNGQLNFVVDYHEQQFQKANIESFATIYSQVLSELVAHCQQDGVGSYTPSDFLLVDIVQERLDTLQSQYPSLEDIYPATGMQSGLIFHSLLDESHTTYATQLSLQIGGVGFDIDLFKQAWGKVIQRHAIFRTAFIDIGQQHPVQLVQEQVDIPWQEQDVRALSVEEQSKALAMLSQSEKELGFEFAEAPLMRFSALREQDDVYRFVWTYHHSILDGWCLPIVVGEVVECYRSFRQGKPPALPSLPPYREYIRWLTAQDQEAAREYWRGILAGIESATPLSIDKLPVDHRRRGLEERALVLSEAQTKALTRFASEQRVTVNTLMQGAWAYLLHRYSGESDVVFGATISGRSANVPGIEQMMGVFINSLPVRVEIGQGAVLGDWLRAIHLAQGEREAFGYLPLADIQGCSEVMPGNPLFSSLLIFENYPTGDAVAGQGDDELAVSDVKLDEGTNYDLTLYIEPAAELKITFSYLAEHFGDEAVDRMIAHTGIIIDGMISSTNVNVSELPYLSEEEHEELSHWNNTATEFACESSIHQQFEEQVARIPDEIACVYKDESVTYLELNERANQLAHSLKEKGAGPDKLVGICLERSIDMMVGLLAVLKAGAAYVPLDPSYPIERLKYMIEDSQCIALITQTEIADFLVDVLPDETLCLDDHQTRASVGKLPTSNPTIPEFTSANLSYVIYTSGSTGKPKGVMVEHKNVMNFFAALDQKFDWEEAKTWLAVTSISFDISVLELFWTLSRGDKIVLAPERVQSSSNAKDPEFSLFYFAAEEAREGSKYHLLLEGAKFADQHNFAGVWVPERHFNSFGDQFPNPSVAGAAVAVVTQNIKVRSGSVVLPLHDPIRVAEEWSMVDNLSNGRVELSIASGWHPNDFVFMPDDYEERHRHMIEKLVTLNELWQGKSTKRRNGVGKNIDIVVHPKPVQSILTNWITAAGDIRTFEYAGSIGANLLTHLLGQTVEQLSEKISAYKNSRAENGFDPKEGKVALMIHTYIGESKAEVNAKVEEPFKNYLRHSVGLLKPLVEEAELSLDDDLETIIDMAFERYFNDSGLFGTVESVAPQVDKILECGVDELACLIDFGIDHESVLASLDHLNELQLKTKHKCKQQQYLAKKAERDWQDNIIADAIANHGVTHIQCTPSYARQVVDVIENNPKERGLEAVCVGGEAFPLDLAEQLCRTVEIDVYNMYGPTETTIWSAISRVGAQNVYLSGPIANTTFYIVNNGKLVPTGVPGELYIGGDGVTRGYLNRPDITADKFVVNSFDKSDTNLVYRTGDLVRRQNNGSLEFLGRIDEQVKIRGFRIELGEIEAQLSQLNAVEKNVVVAKETEHGGKQIVAYLKVLDGYIAQSPDGEAKLIDSIRKSLSSILPDYMVPAAFVIIDEFPLTPNGKINKRALPSAEYAGGVEVTYEAPASETESVIAKIWSELLSIDEEMISVTASFFLLGGHSLLAVKMANELSIHFLINITIKDVFANRTIRELAESVDERISMNDLKSSVAFDSSNVESNKDNETILEI